MSDSKMMPVTLLDWRPMIRNTLRGFATIRLGTSLKIRHVAVHVHPEGRRWAQLPSKPIISQDGTAQRTDDGKIRYALIMEWGDRAAADRFSAAVIAAIEAQHDIT